MRLSTILAIGVLSFTGFADNLLGRISDDLVLAGGFCAVVWPDDRISGGWLWSGDLWAEADAASYDGIGTYSGAWLARPCAV